MKQLVEVNNDVSTPTYVLERPLKHLSCVFPERNGGPALNILDDWPQDFEDSSMDASQISALHRVLSKSIAVIQGPPGTGKTYLSVKALKIMLSNWVPSDGPIILACQTNHALDQLLRHVAEFEPCFVRLGGRSKDTGVTKARTLHEVKLTSVRHHSSVRSHGRRQIVTLTRKMMDLLRPFAKDSDVLNLDFLRELGLLTEGQCESLETGAAEWVHSNVGEQPSPMRAWLGKQLVRTKVRAAPTDFGFEFEDVDLEFEELKEEEAEVTAADDDDGIEKLRGEHINLGDAWTGIGGDGVRNIGVLLSKTNNLWNISLSRRGAIYRYLVKQAKSKKLSEFKTLAIQYSFAMKQCKIGGWERDFTILKNQKIIGMTTTGFSKNRGLLSSLCPKIVMVEEAAETLEAPVIGCCTESVQHLILVGDHQQLRPRCHVRELEEAPYNLNVSLFERLIRNNIEFSMLRRQRRMIPQIRMLLYPIYKDAIQDHECVKDPVQRPPVPGMGTICTYFLDHGFQEQQDDLMSTYNRSEADMIVGFVRYLILNGAQAKNITLLTFYNGQRRMLARSLRGDQELSCSLTGIKLVTVDSYQGEENQIVILSLVRSRRIGFLSVVNRVCVALSRAQRGLYIFGNAQFLAEQSEVWAEVLRILEVQIIGNLDSTRLPLTCQPHMRRTYIKGIDPFPPSSCSVDNDKPLDPNEWHTHAGGCDLKCKATLPCGHACPLLCHPFVLGGSRS